MFFFFLLNSVSILGGVWGGLGRLERTVQTNLALNSEIYLPLTSE